MNSRREIQVEDALPLGVGILLSPEQRGASAPADRVDDDVHVTERIDRLLDGQLRLLPRHHISGNHQCVPAALFHGGARLIETRGRTRDDGHIRAHPGKRGAGPYPDPAGAAADDRHATVQPEPLQFVGHSRPPVGSAVSLSHSEVAFRV